MMKGERQPLTPKLLDVCVWRATAAYWRRERIGPSGHEIGEMCFISRETAIKYLNRLMLFGVVDLKTAEGGRKMRSRGVVLLLEPPESDEDALAVLRAATRVFVGAPILPEQREAWRRAWATTAVFPGEE